MGEFDDIKEAIRRIESKRIVERTIDIIRTTNNPDVLAKMAADNIEKITGEKLSPEDIKKQIEEFARTRLPVEEDDEDEGKD